MHEPARHIQPTTVQLAAEFAHRRLTWWPQLGIGWYPVEAGIAPYDRDYFDRFARDAQSDLGRALMQARCDLVDRHYQGDDLIDVGIGCGAFIETRTRASFGFDVNPAGIEWLVERKLLADPYYTPFDAMTLWDVLEHIPDFPRLLAGVRTWVFTSLPIFRDAEHALRSKHFRPLEHCWYFSRDGLVHTMKLCGFDLVEESNIETVLGREDIDSFVFKRSG